MAKIRKFREGSTVEDAEEARYKTAGLAASNAELESGKRKPSGFLGLGRFLEGNIDQKGSEAYNLYGAGYGREVEATNTRLKEKTEREAAVDAKQRSDKERDARAAASEDDPERKYFGAGNRPSASELATAAAAGSGATTPDKNDKGARSGAAPAAKASTGSTSGSDYRGPMERRKLSVSESASGSAGQKGPTYAQVDAEKQKGFTASPMSTDQAQRAAATAARAAAAAKAAADAAANAPRARNPETDEGEDVRPASQAQLKALAAIARATGNTSGVANNRVVTAAEAARKIAEYAKKIGNTALSVGDSFKKEKYKAKGGAIQSYAKGGSVSASSRGDGIAQRGKTRGRVC